MNREAIYTALFAKVSAGEGMGSVDGWTGPALGFTSRRVRMFDNLPAKPACCQIEPGESYTQNPNLPYKIILEAEWWFFHEAGADETAIPTITDNQIMDAVDAALAPEPYRNDERQTLGELVYHCFIDGTVIKVAGDIAGQALVCVPIKLLVP